MGIGINDFRMAIRIDNAEAKQKLTEMKERVSELREELIKMDADGKKDTAEYNKKKEVLDKLNKEYAVHKKTVGLTALTYDELRKGARTLKSQMDRSIPGSEKWTTYREELKMVEARMKELRGQADTTKFSLSKMADGFNKYAAMGAGVVASLTGVALTARKCVDEFAQMEEAESQVRKYTGMTTEEVKALNEEFKNMDTRTARTRLNELAGEAGRLGITGKQDVLEFVEAANMIDVALGEDLGEDAIKNIGKLAEIFGDSERSMKDNMLAIGSAVNEVAQNSSAAEPYLVEFTARMGGVAKQAKLSVTDVMGFASALDQNMLRSEMASTALQALLLKLYQEPAKYAKLAKMDVEQFTKLMETDANEAMLQFLGSLGKMGSMDKMAPVLKAMKLSGAEAAGVISALAGNVEKVRKEQETANRAFQDGTSAVNEYGVQNSTVQAELDKAKQHFADIRVELGERLLPMMKYMISTGSMTVKGMSAVIGIMSEYKSSITLATLTIAAYTVATKSSIIADKAKVLWTGKVATGLKTLYTTARAHPWGILATAGAVLIGVLIDLKNKRDAVTESTKAINRINKESQKNYDEESYRVRVLTDLIHNENIANEQRKKYIKELKDIIPGYNGMLTDEGKLINDNKEAIEEYLKQLERQIKMKAAEEELVNLYRQKRKSSRQLVEEEKDAVTAKTNLAGAQFVATSRSQKTSTSGTKSLSYGLDQGVKTMETEYNKATEAVKRTKEELKELDNAITDVISEIKVTAVSEVVITPPPGGGTKCPVCGNDPCTCAGDTDKALKEREEVLKQAMNKERNLWKDDYQNKKVTEEEYNQALYDTEIIFLTSKKALLEKYGRDSSEVQGQIYDKMIAEANRLNKAKEDAEKKTKEEGLKQVDKTHESNKAALKEQFLNGEIKTEEDFQKRMKALELAYLEERKLALEKWGEDTTKINGQIQDAKLKQANDAIDKQGKKEEAAKERAKKDYNGRTDSQFANTVVSGLQLIFDNERKIWESEEEYLERLRDKKTAAFKVMEMAATAASNAISALQDREISKITIKYDKQIKAAKKAGKDTTKLEEQKEEEINQVKKKYADKQFAASVLQVVATTAVAAIQAYNAVVGIVPVGPILAPIAAAAAVAAGMAQLASAKQARDEAKGLKAGGYSDDYVEGYTTSGNPDEVAGAIPVHKNEFVTNHEGVANPHVRQFLDVFNVAQKNGSIRMINTTQILEQVRTRSGKYSGGYTNDEREKSYTVVEPTGDIGIGGSEVMKKVVTLLTESNRLLGIISEKELSVDSRAVRDGIRRVEKLEKNVSRG